MSQRNPKRDEARELYIQSGGTLKSGEIAEQIGVLESQVYKWKSLDKWDDNYFPNRKKKAKKDGKKTEKEKRKKGGQKNNKNAVDNDGGAPIGNHNALKHGGYSEIYWDTLDEDERSLIEDMPQDEETLLIDQIKLYTVRERRILLAIQKVQTAKGDQILSSASREETKRVFDGENDEEKAQQKALYKEKIAEKVGSGERLPGEAYQLFTNTENKQNVISRLEDELTRVQRAKNQAIDSLAKLNIEKQKLELIKENNSEIEDTSETDEVIYGENSLQTETNDSV